MILVCAARGRIGSKIIDKLSDDERFQHVIGGVRDTGNCEDMSARGVGVRKVDYDDINCLEAAFSGVERVVFIPSFDDTERRAQQGLNVVQAAQNQGVSQIVFVGFADTRPDSPLPFAKAYATIEAGLQASDLSWTILRTAMYTGNLEEQFPIWLERGELLTCAGDGKIAYVSRDDITSSIVGVLAAPIERHACRLYKLTGPQALSYDEVREIINEFFDAQVVLAQVSVEEFAERIQQIWGVAYPGHEHVARVTPLFQMVFKQGLLSEVTDHVEQLSGSPPEDVRSWLEANIDRSSYINSQMA